MERECSGEGFVSAMVFFLLGGVLGAGAGLLLAPKSGRETRERIRDMTEDVKEATGDYYERVKKTVVSALENGQELLEEKKERITTAVRAGMEAYEKGGKKAD